MRRPRIYVAGPYTLGNVAVNVRAAVDVADALATLGCVPYVPHLSHFWELVHPRPYAWWLAFDVEWLRVCDAVFCLRGKSVGAELEVAYATETLHLPVFYEIDAVSAWLVAWESTP